MENEVPKAPTSTTPSTLVSPWVTYLTEKKKVSAGQFLRDMEEGVIAVRDETTGKTKKKKTRSIIRPDERVRDQFVNAFADAPDGVERLLLLLQASASMSDTMRRIVMELTEAGIKRLGKISLPEPLDATAFNQAVSSWLTGMRKKPLKSADLKVLLLHIQFGWSRQLLDHDTAFRLVASAVTKPSKAPPTHAGAARPTPTLLDVLLAATTTGSVLPSLLGYFDASNAAVNELNAQIQSQAAQIARLTTESAKLRDTTADLHTENVTLKEQRDVAAMTIAQLERQAVNTRASYQHKLDDLRGRIRGTLQGQVTRWLQTSLDAARATPPRTEVVEERLEEALKLIEKELQWLQPSA